MGEPDDLSVMFPYVRLLYVLLIYRSQGAIVFMASDASRFMTGNEILIDGGYCAI